MKKGVTGAQSCFNLESEYGFGRDEGGQCSWTWEESLEGMR